MQLAHLEVAQLNLGAFTTSSLPLFLLWSHAPDQSPEQAPGCFLEKSVALFILRPHQRKNVAQGHF